MDLTAILSSVQAIIGTVASAITSGLQVAHNAITQRRAIIGQEIISFMNIKTYNYKDTIYAVIALIAILGLAYITKKK